MNIIDQREINGDLVLVVDELPELGLVVEIGDIEYKVVDVDRFSTNVNHMVVVERV